MPAFQDHLQQSQPMHVSGIRVRAALEQLENKLHKYIPRRQMQPTQSVFIPSLRVSAPRSKGTHATAARSHCSTRRDAGRPVPSIPDQQLPSHSPPRLRWMRMTYSFPLRGARSDCVSPRLVCAGTSALCSRSLRTASACPRNDAGCHRVDPSSS